MLRWANFFTNHLTADHIGFQLVPHRLGAGATLAYQPDTAAQQIFDRRDPDRKASSALLRLPRSTQAGLRGSSFLRALRRRQGVSRLSITVALPDEGVSGNSFDAIVLELGIAGLGIRICAHLGSFRTFALNVRMRFNRARKHAQLDRSCSAVLQGQLIR